MRLAGLKQKLHTLVWEGDLDAMPWWRQGVIHFLRVVSTVLMDLWGDHLSLYATSLVYTTLLSLVPLLAVSFSVLKGFGVHNQIEPFLMGLLGPLGAKGTELANRIIGFVQNVNVGVLGTIGFIALFYTVVSLIQKVEHALNAIWHVPEPRSVLEQFGNYFTAVVIGPVLLFTAMGITASVLGSSTVKHIATIHPLGEAIGIGTTLLTYLLVIIAFTFIYLFMPNTRVRPSAALKGGVTGAVLWQSIGWAFGSFIASSTRYTAIYSSFAILFLFMFWLYLTWLILLIGGSVAFYYQHSEYLGYMVREVRLSNRLREQVALLVGVLVARRHYQGERPWTTNELAQELAVPESALRPVLWALQQGRLLVSTQGDPPAWLPGRDIARIPLTELLGAVRTYEDPEHLPPRRVRSLPAVDELLAHIDASVVAGLEEHTLRDLVVASATAGTPPQRPDTAGARTLGELEERRSGRG